MSTEITSAPSLSSPAAPSPHAEPTPLGDKWTSLTFKFSVFFAFFWSIFGLAVIYGIRVWWNSPIHPSFVPFMGVGFAVIVSFAIVLTLKHASGEPIEFKLFGNEWKGASGPIFLWVLCFVAIVYGLYLWLFRRNCGCVGGREIGF